MNRVSSYQSEVRLNRIMTIKIIIIIYIIYIYSIYTYSRLGTG